MITDADLLNEYSLDGRGWARFDKEWRYRFRLGRKLTPKALSISWDDIIAWQGVRRVVFVMLNPSTADAFKPDRTVDRCCEFARRWGADVVEVVNLFALISTKPKRLATVLVPGWSPLEAAGGMVKNNLEILAACRGADRVIAAWGNGGELYNRAERVQELLADHGVELEAFRLSKHGFPNHPLARGKNYIPYETEPRPLRELAQ